MALRGWFPMGKSLQRTRTRRRRNARGIAADNRMVVVPLLEHEPTRHALDLACRLAAERRARVLLLAPLFVDLELPLDAHFQGEERALRVELGRERALAESYGVAARGRIIRTRPGQLGRAVADAAEGVHASLVVVGAAIESRRGFRHPFSRDLWSVLNDAPCPVMVATASHRVQTGAAG